MKEAVQMKKDFNLFFKYVDVLRKWNWHFHYELNTVQQTTRFIYNTTTKHIKLFVYPGENLSWLPPKKIQ